jgi:phytoene synthase
MPSDADFYADLLACRAALRGGSRTFFAAARVLPPRVSRPATALYAFCREADDAIDCGGGTLASLTLRLDAIYAGRPQPRPADRALAEVVARFGLPRMLLDALLEGFAWDTEGRRYETLAELQDYAARVAGTVGAIMALLMGARTPALVARACDLGTAMQLTNIARDVGEDARAGRLYLPQAWLRDEGIDPATWLRDPQFGPALGRVVQRLLGEADALYRRADTGIAGLPWDCRPGIAAARLLYAQIGVEVTRNGYDSVTRRAVVPGTRKLALLGRAVATGLVRGEASGTPALAACSALVHAAASPIATLPRRRFDDRLAWLFDLFTRPDGVPQPAPASLR